MRAAVRHILPWVAALASLLAAPVAAREPAAARLEKTIFPPGWSAPVRAVATSTSSARVVPTEVGDRYVGFWAPRTKFVATPAVFCTNTAETHERVEPPAAPVFAGVSFSTGATRTDEPGR